MGNGEQAVLQNIRQGDRRALARAISYVENGMGDYGRQLADAPADTTPVIGITGPPGAGKSTLADALIGAFTAKGKKVAILCIDPSSTFHFGALLGDRIRMNDWFSHPLVFIRSLATRGALGGLHPRIIEILALVRSASFDLILIETVGVGQNEIEIAGLADTVVVVLAPESGDDIQSMKSGLLEIADIFVVNKSDRPDADLFVRNLRSMQPHEIPVFKTVASEKQGIAELVAGIETHGKEQPSSTRRWRLLADQAWLLIQRKKMRSVDKKGLTKKVEDLCRAGTFNLYKFVEEWE
ncbi:MAG TPA: methylmalonyl Co-A mutase-associated GTPase MeaB [Puia sp.]|jgi:LAO/AO transport system kinase